MANPDIDTPSDLVAAYPAFPNLLANEQVRAAFATQEQRATRAKRIYTILGHIGLFAAFLSFTAVIFIVSLEHFFFEEPKFFRPSDELWFKFIFFGVGLTGLAAQMALLFSPLKKRWLNARFRAERLRSIKFQAFQAAACGGDSAVAAFTSRAVAVLKSDTEDEDNALAARHNFNPEAELARVDGEPCAAGHDLKQLRECYAKLRVDRQATFASGELKRITEERRLPASASEIAFWLGAALAFVDAILTFVEVSWAPLRPLMHFATLELFVVSALLFVHERGRAYVSALERYEDYRDDMVRLAERLNHANTAAEFQACVREGELHALKELKIFCREAERSTYLI